MSGANVNAMRNRLEQQNNFVKVQEAKKEIIDMGIFNNPNINSVRPEEIINSKNDTDAISRLNEEQEYLDVLNSLENESEKDEQAKIDSKQKEFLHGKKIEDLKDEEYAKYLAAKESNEGEPIPCDEHGVSKIQYGDYTETTITLYNGMQFDKLSSEEQDKVLSYEKELDEWEANDKQGEKPVLNMKTETETRVQKDTTFKKLTERRLELMEQLNEYQKESLEASRLERAIKEESMIQLITEETND